MFKAVERKKGIMYKEYRSQFLVFWCICNLIVGYGFVYLYTSGRQDIIFYIGSFLTSVLVFRIVFSTIHNIKAKYDRFRVAIHCRKQVSTVFNDLKAHMEDNKEQIFAVYFDNHGNSALIKKDDPRYNQSVVKSSIKASNVYRGFSLIEINKKHQISQNGLVDHRISGLNAPVYTHEMEKFFDEDSDEDEEDDDNFDDVDSDSNTSEKSDNKKVENRSISKKSSSNTKTSSANKAKPKLDIISPTIVNPFQNSSTL